MVCGSGKEEITRKTEKKEILRLNEAFPYSLEVLQGGLGINIL
jgi:hypothetical protein